MEATQLFLSSPTLSCKPFSIYSIKSPRQKNHVGLTVKARRGTNGSDHRGGVVDENMIVLRMRIKEMHELETSYEPPSNWMEWEKKYYVHYNEDICEAMGLLQTYLMNISPSLALGTIALIMFSVLLSAGVVACHAIEIVTAILSRFHLSSF